MQAVTLNAPPPAGAWARWRLAWRSSLRVRLLVLGLMPLLVAFPLVIGVLLVAGGERVGSLLRAQLSSNLVGSRNYLDQRKADTALRLGQLARSERLVQLLAPGSDTAELQRVLHNTAEANGLDFLLVATADGRVVAASAGVAAGHRLPDSFVLRQARLGMTTAAYERFDAAQLQAFSPQFPAQARVQLVRPRPDGSTHETRGLLIHAAAHLPLSTRRPDTVLAGGLLLNRNQALIEHLRAVIYPLGSLPDDAEGSSALFIEDISVTSSRQRQRSGQRLDGIVSPTEAWHEVSAHGRHWLGQLEEGGQRYRAGFDPLTDGTGQRIGMVAAGFPDAPFRKAALWALAGVAALLAVAMCIISVVFLRAGQDLTHRLALIVDTMSAVRGGNREARVGRQAELDEPGQLARHFDTLLDTIAAQDAAQRAAQQTIADEATRRRALFEHERDGVLILNADGSVFEANPRGAAMLGCSAEEAVGLHVSRWDVAHDAPTLALMLAGAGPEGRFFETVVQRRDGSTYDAEVSLSRAEWGDRTFVLWLQRDISKRKAVEAELARYRSDLEALVEARTQALNERSAQLDAIFELSPDGFISFDRGGRVTLANPAFLQLTGLELDGLRGLDEEAFTAQLATRCAAAAPFPGLPALRAAAERAAERLALGLGDASPGPLRFELAEPRARVLQVELRQSETANVSQVLAFRDITYETEVDRLKSEFLTMAAHELRTPMASIAGYTELLLARDYAPEKRRELLGIIMNQSRVMTSIINELLDLARIEARGDLDFEIERRALQQAVAAAVEQYGPPAGRSKPTVEGGQEALYARFDLGKLQQVVTNLLSNAYKYSPQGGEVLVRYLHEPGDGAGTAARVGVRVTDHGIGMTPAQCARVFERFYRADASGHIPGTGLGMSIAKELMELQGGSIEVRSAPFVGTTVTLWLPQD